MPEFLLNIVVPLVVGQAQRVTLTLAPGDQVSVDRADPKLLVVEFQPSSARGASESFERSTSSEAAAGLDEL